MKVLQCGYPKSGNYFLYNNLHSIMECTGQTFQTKISKLASEERIGSGPLSNRQQANIDWIEFDTHRLFLGLGSVLKVPITETLGDYLENDHLVWSHSNANSTMKSHLSDFDKVVYIYRDPRSILVSKAHAGLQDYGKVHYPSPGKTPTDVAVNALGNILMHWSIHLLSWATTNGDILFVNYTDLKNDKISTLKQIISYLGLELTDEQLAIIAQNTSLENMQKKEGSDVHVRTGSDVEWKNVLPMWVQIISYLVSYLPLKIIRLRERGRLNPYALFLTKSLIWIFKILASVRAFMRYWKSFLV